MSIVNEARAGYIEKAKKALLEKLEELKAGKPIHLSTGMIPPPEYLSAYDTAIQMLEWTSDPVITLTATEFRQFVMDEWDWLDTFLSSNSSYSNTATVMYAALSQKRSNFDF